MKFKKTTFIALIFAIIILFSFDECTNIFMEQILRHDDKTDVSGIPPAVAELPLVTYTVSFSSNGGSPVGSQIVSEGSAATRPYNPTKNGYGFENWYCDSDLAILYDFNTPVTAAITLYAKWSDIFYTVTFESNGGTKAPSQNVAEGGTASRPVPSKADHILTGWYADPGLTALYDFDTPITCGITLYAGWRYLLPLEDINDIISYLAMHTGNIDNPVVLPVHLSLGTMTQAGSTWRQLLDALETAGEYVSLDLSGCTMNGTTFNPDSTIKTGKNKIVSITLPDTAQSILNGTYTHPSFNYFTALKSFSGAGLSSIGSFAFYDCTSLILDSLPERLSSIGNCAFEGCTSLALTSLPAGLSYIGSSAFSGCTNLALTSLPSGLSSIEIMAFSRCTNLTHISLPSGLSSIGYAAFQDCTSLVQITSLGSTPPALGTSVFSGTHTNLSIKVPAASVNEYKAAWSEYADRIVAIE